MQRRPAALTLFGAVLLAASSASAQSSPPATQLEPRAPMPSAPLATERPAATPSNPATSGDHRPAAGSNSFTEAQARSRIEAAGYTGVTALTKRDDGVWRGRASRDGAATDVALDFQGGVYGGEAARGATAAREQAPADGTPGNPPGTAIGRAADRAVGTPDRRSPPGAAPPVR